MRMHVYMTCHAQDFPAAIPLFWSKQLQLQHAQVPTSMDAYVELEHGIASIANDLCDTKQDDKQPVDAL